MARTAQGARQCHTNTKQYTDCNLRLQDLSAQLAEITGFDSVSLQPNSGASGEYAGLMAIRAFHRANGDEQRKVATPHIHNQRHKSRWDHSNASQAKPAAFCFIQEPLLFAWHISFCQAWW